MLYDQTVFDEFSECYPPGHFVDASSCNTSQLLYSLVRLIQPCHVVEIGTWDGATSIWLARAIAENGRGSYTGYEVMPAKADEARRNLERAVPGGKWTVHNADFLTIPYIETDFLFMDHEKTQYGAAFGKCFVPLNGYVLAHDTQAWPAAVQFWKNMSVMPGWELLNIQEERGLMIARKVAG